MYFCFLNTPQQQQHLLTNKQTFMNSSQVEQAIPPWAFLAQDRMRSKSISSWSPVCDDNQPEVIKFKKQKIMCSSLCRCLSSVGSYGRFSESFFFIFVSKGLTFSVQTNENRT